MIKHVAWGGVLLLGIASSCKPDAPAKITPSGLVEYTTSHAYCYAANPYQALSCIPRQNTKEVKHDQ